MSEQPVPTAVELFRESKPDPADIVCANGLRASLGRHPLLLPADDGGETVADYSLLPLDLHGLARVGKTPKLPSNIEPLARLCQDCTDEIREGDQWDYEYFYLEVLGREGKLPVLFWASPEIAHALQTDERTRYGWLAGQAGPEPVRELCRQVWLANVDRWAEQMAIEMPAEDKPWLDYLEVIPREELQAASLSGGRWTASDQLTEELQRFPRRLRWRMLPFYEAALSRDRLIAQMRREVWQTSIFCPLLASNVAGTQVKHQKDRMCLHYRREAAQRVRSQRLTEYVLKQHAQGVSAHQIANEVLDQGFYPTQFRASTPTSREGRVASARRRVLAILREHRSDRP